MTQSVVLIFVFIKHRIQGYTPRTRFYTPLVFLSIQLGKTTSDLLPVVSRKPAVISFRALCRDLLSATRRWRQGSKITATSTTKTAPVTVGLLGEKTAWRQMEYFFSNINTLRNRHKWHIVSLRGEVLKSSCKITKKIIPSL